MGGRGSGGARVSAGRKPNALRGRGAAGAMAPEDVPVPPDLGRAARAVWEAWAGEATAAGTLTPATAGDFRDLAELVVEQRAVLAARRRRGWSETGLKLAREYRGLTQRVETKRRAFCLAPIGRAMPAKAAPQADPFDEFDEKARPPAPFTVVQGGQQRSTRTTAPQAPRTRGRAAGS